MSHDVDMRGYLIGQALQALITRHDGQASEDLIAERAIVYADMVLARLQDEPRGPAMTLTPEEIERARKRGT
jgi:hypothetical protein